eukprot:CAMPEP_0179866940 /NCGR_PEP_ID=MMETSP0982-20121206/17832_1 /TAXON_ID=483367 /ORGANISM="non described non described, Strain CCMP 2436" /LENGTH=137 /DNA_ID=CAMNT_0021756121 /DNA_START=102 /DNA_END=516 /DNA_ORIENTATION=-
MRFVVADDDDDYNDDADFDDDDDHDAFDDDDDDCDCDDDDDDCDVDCDVENDDDIDDYDRCSSSLSSAATSSGVFSARFVTSSTSSNDLLFPALVQRSPLFRVISADGGGVSWRKVRVGELRCLRARARGRALTKAN